MAIDYDELEQALARMSVRTRLYQLVKAEMVKRGNWKHKPRGVGFKKGYDPHRKKLKPEE